jgi:capsule polysaccharide modification protein KpsS
VKKFAIECPQLLVFKREDNMFLLPPSVKSRGESVLLRVNMDELVAGQLYVYVLRLLYGKLEVDRLHKQFKTSASCIEETMASFRETGKTDDQNRA